VWSIPQSRRTLCLVRHGQAALSGSKTKAPGFAGGYLLLTLKSYRDGPRPGADTAMSAGVAGLTDPDLAALAHYAASR
jgi:cytochrome c553